MAKILVLPPHLASQIAAGEVVERPASVVKELVENALDAGASRCDIAIEAGGVARLCVTDDGAGMGEDDALLCLQRHATSKIRAFEDLLALSSHGFRGEAMPSIASVSRLTISTREARADAGVEVTVEGGGPPVSRPVGRPQGTSVEVRDLFFNVPARRKFLRSTGTEAGHVTEVVEALALTRSDVSFTLQRDGRQVREFLRAESRHVRVAQTLPEEELVRCEGTRGPLRIEAFLSRPERARQGAQGLRFIVNGRSIRDRMLAATVAQAYGSVLERGRYPRGVVYLDIESALVDVNVHPQKAEVRFVEPRAVADAVHAVLTRVLANTFSSPHRDDLRRGARPPSGTSSGSVAREDATAGARVVEGTVTRLGRPEVDPPSRAYPDLGSAPGLAASSSSLSPPPSPGGAASRDVATELLTRKVVPASAPLLAIRDAVNTSSRPRQDVRWSALRFVAQLRQMYLLCEDDEGIHVIDQHAAAERVNFDRLRRQFRSASVKSQALLFPVTLAVLPSELDCIQEYAESIAEMGIDVRPRGAEMVSVHAVPTLLQRASPERLIRDLVAELGRSGGRDFSASVDLALATMACHGSLRSGDPVSPEAAAALLKALDEADFAGYCPHGRPIVTSMSYMELDRKVGRR